MVVAGDEREVCVGAVPVSLGHVRHHRSVSLSLQRTKISSQIPEWNSLINVTRVLQSAYKSGLACVGSFYGKL